jgi:hypothetical protein
MKNFLKFLGIIAMVAVIGFSMAACSDDDSGDDSSGNNNGGGNFSELQGAYTTSINLQTRIFSEAGDVAGLQAGKANMVISGNKLTVSAAEDFAGGGGDLFKKDDEIVQLTIKELTKKDELSTGDVSTYKLETEDSMDVSLVYTESWNGTVQLYFVDKDGAMSKFIIICTLTGNQSVRFIPQN